MDLVKTTTGSEKKIRLTQAEKLQAFEEKLSRGMSQRKAANLLGIARKTLLDWKDRQLQPKERDSLYEQVASFSLSSDDGDIEGHAASIVKAMTK